MSSVKLTTTGGNGGTLELKAPANTTSNAAVQLTLPVDDGAANTFLKSNGSGVTSWAGPTATEIATTSGTASASTFLCGNNTWAEAGGGKILQIQSTTKKDIVSTSSSSFALITGLTVSITPTSSSNKIWIMYNLAIGTDTNAYTRLRLARGSTTDINIGDASGDHTRCTHFRFMSNAGVSAGDWSDVDTWHFAGNYLDSPSTTSSTTYGLYWAVDDATLKLNTVHATSYGDDVGTSTSTITAMEVGT